MYSFVFVGVTEALR